MKANKKIIFCLVGFALLPLACKVNYTLNGASIPPEAKTVCIKYFENTSSLAPPTTSQAFTEALRNIISSQTRLALVANNGDLTFEGKLTGYSITPQSIQSGAVSTAALNRLSITVNVKYTCSFDEKKNFEQAFTRFFDYPSTNLQSDVENTDIPLVLQPLVQDIFNKAFNDW